MSETIDVVEEVKLDNPTIEKMVQQNLDNFGADPSLAPEGDPLDVAAQMAYLYIPKFKLLLSKLSKKALLRVVYNLVQYPLEEEYDPKGEVEKNAFVVGDRLLSAKYLMLLGSLVRDENMMKTVEEKFNNEEPKKEEKVND